MAVSIALVVLLGLLSDYLLSRFRMPGLLGMLVIGILCGPYVFNLMEPELLKVSADWRMVALVVILLRAGLKIRRQTIKKVGRRALLLSFLPSTLEGLAITFLAPHLFPVSRTEAAILGFIIAAVSPAVVVPSMIKFIEEKRGTGKGIPTMILASSSLDNAYVIVVFTAVLGMYSGATSGSMAQLLEIPESMAFGIMLGGATGFVLYHIFEQYRLRATKMTLVVMATSILLIWLQEAVKTRVSMSALLAIMTVGFIILEKSEARAHKISQKLSKVWIFAEILLFVLVGAQVNLTVAWDAGVAGALLILAGLVARSIGTFLSVMGGDMNMRERLFCIIAYIPKATVQAAIGAVPLEAGVRGGEVILAVAVLSILITAPIGAVGITLTGGRWLEKEGGGRQSPGTHEKRQ